MNRLFVCALMGLGFLGLAGGSAQAAGWHRANCRPVCSPAVNCTVPTPVVTAAPAVSAPALCAPVVSYARGYRWSHYNRFDCRPRAHYRRWCP